jgi:hypothetical protein
MALLLLSPVSGHASLYQRAEAAQRMIAAARRRE